jgi:hypothetical protein
MTVDLKKLREAAEKADECVTARIAGAKMPEKTLTIPVALDAYITAVNPPTILALLDALDAAEARVAGEWKPGPALIPLSDQRHRSVIVAAVEAERERIARFVKKMDVGFNDARDEIVAAIRSML